MHKSTDLYPLKFREIYRTYGVGGRKLEECWNKDLPKDTKVAESWEITDHDGDISVVKNGYLEGEFLRGLIWEERERLLGDEIYEKFNFRFPLLIKLLDAAKSLTVQIHPNDSYAKAHDLDYNGKDEVYYILDAKEDSVIHWGIQPEVSRQDFAQAIRQERALELCNKIPVEAGDVIPVPSRFVHAIGEGLIVEEVQQSADITFEPKRVKKTTSDKVYELFNSPKSEEIFIDQLWGGEVDPEMAKIEPLIFNLPPNLHKYLYANSNFALEYLELKEEIELESDRDRFYIFTGISNTGKIIHKNGSEIIRKGETVLIPAHLGNFSVKPVSENSCKLLKIYVPDLTEDVIKPLTKAGFNKEEIMRLGGHGYFNDLKEFYK